MIGLAASRGNVYSGFESPIQSYAIVTNSPGLNIDRSNNASIVHRDPDFDDGKHVLEDVKLWNALAGSGQILTNGVKTIPDYTDATHPDELLTPGPVPPLGPMLLTYTRGGRHWYYLSNARTAIGLTEDGRTLVLFTVDGTNGGHGMQVAEVADLLKNEYGVWNALNLDGGGSTTMAMEDPVTNVRKLVNSPSDNPPRRRRATSPSTRTPSIRSPRRSSTRRQRERLEPHGRQREPRRHRSSERDDGQPPRMGRPAPVLAGRCANGRGAGRARQSASFGVAPRGHDRQLLRDRRGRQRRDGRTLASGSRAPPVRAVSPPRGASSGPRTTSSSGLRSCAPATPCPASPPAPSR